MYRSRCEIKTYSRVTEAIVLIHIEAHQQIFLKNGIFYKNCIIRNYLDCHHWLCFHINFRGPLYHQLGVGGFSIIVGSLKYNSTCTIYNSLSIWIQFIVVAMFNMYARIHDTLHPFYNLPFRTIISCSAVHFLYLVQIWLLSIKYCNISLYWNRYRLPGKLWVLGSGLLVKELLLN